MISPTGMRLAINRTDLPLSLRLAVMEAMQANGEFARADALGDDERASVLVRVAQVAEGALCDAIVAALAAVERAS